MTTTCDTHEGWALMIDEELERVAQARKNVDDSYSPMMFLVPSYIKTLNQRAYEHRMLSFGLYNRDFVKMTRMDEVRLEVVSEFLEQMKMISNSNVDSWDALCERVAGPTEAARALHNLYDDGPDETILASSTARSVLVFDAVFLTIFLLLHHKDLQGVHCSLQGSFERFKRIFYRKGVNRNLNAVYCDVWMLENQVPLCLIRNVCNHMLENVSDACFNTHLSQTVRIAMEKFLPPQVDVMFDHDICFVKCSHLLQCLYIAVCHHNPPSSASQDPQPEQSSTLLPVRAGAKIFRISGLKTLLENLSTFLVWFQTRMTSILTFSRATGCSKLLTCLVWLQTRMKSILPFSRATRCSNFEHLTLRSMLPITELLKAGILVRGTRTSVSDVRFDKSSFLKATLSLPQIFIDDNTEMILRNLASFEMINTGDGYKLISYLSIMDDLINTEEDVRCLRKGKEPVIVVNLLGDDKDIAGLFNALGRNVHFTTTEECRNLIKEVNEWCMQENRQKLRKFIDRFHDRPWILGSLIAATLLLCMTALQTIYTIILSNQK